MRERRQRRAEVRGDNDAAGKASLCLVAEITMALLTRGPGKGLVEAL